MTKQVFITGGSGYLGSHLIDEIAKNNDIQAFFSTRRESSDSRALVMDLRKESDFTKYVDTLENTEYLIHAAANVSHDQDSRGQRIVDGITIIGNLIRHLPNLKRVIFVSSTSAEMADTDSSLYGLNKLVDEEMLKALLAEKGIELVILRFPQIYGPGEVHGTFVTKFIAALQKGEPLVLENHGAVSKDILYIKDAVGSIICALESTKPGLYTVTDNDPVTVGQVLSTLESILGVKAKIHEVQIDEVEIKNKSFHFPGNISELGYNIKYKLREGLTETVDKRMK